MSSSHDGISQLPVSTAVGSKMAIAAFDPTQPEGSPKLRQVLLNSIGPSATAMASPNVQSYVPLFTSISAALDSPSGLSIDPSGVGLVASVNGSAGAGNIVFPRGIDYTKPWRFACLVEVNDATNNISISLWNTAGTNAQRSGCTFNANTSKCGIVTGFVNSLTNLFLSGGGLPNKTQLWLTITSDGQNVTCAILPTTMTGGLSTGADAINQTAAGGGYFTSAYNALLDSGQPATGCPSGVAHTWENMGYLKISNSSATSRVLGYYFCAGSLAGPADGKFKPPFLLEPVINNEVSAFIIGAGSYGSGNTSLCLVHHQYTEDGNILAIMGNHTPAASAATVNQLWQNGFTALSVYGASQYVGDFLNKEPSAQNWGAPAGLVYRRAAVDWARKFMPKHQKLVHLGFSMGALNALNYEMQFGGQSAAICTVSAVANIATTYALGTFAASFHRGWSRWYLCLNPLTPSSTTPGSDATNWLPLNFDQEGVADPLFISPSYTNKNTWVTGTNYNPGDVVSVDSSLTATQIASYDPTLNAGKLANIPILMLHALDDPTIPPSQSSALVQDIVNAGGNATFIASGSGHATASVFQPVTIQNFLAAAVGSSSPGLGIPAVDGYSAVPTDYIYLVPATGFTANMARGVRYLVIDPAAGLAAGTVNLPPAPADGDLATLSSTQLITSLTLGAASGSGQSVADAITTLAAAGAVTYKYIAIKNAWYLVD